MKMAPCILQSPPTWSNSLYYYNGGSVANRRDSETARVYFRRVMLANRDMSVLKTKWQQKLASDLASCTRWHRDPTPIVLKSKWQAKWDELQDTLTPHQIVDMHLARRIWKLNVWTWEKERIAAGSCLRSVFIWVPMWNSARLRHFFYVTFFAFGKQSFFLLPLVKSLAKQCLHRKNNRR